MREKGFILGLVVVQPISKKVTYIQFVVLSSEWGEVVLLRFVLRYQRVDTS